MAIKFINFTNPLNGLKGQLDNVKKNFTGIKFDAIQEEYIDIQCIMIHYDPEYRSKALRTSLMW